MHPRHRNPGNWYRSGSVGMGLGASRISPEGSARGHGGYYNPEFRGYNRGFGRGQGQPKTYKRQQPLPQRGDIFMEAGRLAAEYLVSQGLLPPSALSGKWQSDGFRNQVGDFQEYRGQEGDNLQFPPEVRTSVHSRLGNVVADAGASSRRRSFNDDYSSGSRSYVKGRRRQGSFRANGPNWSQEDGRSASRVDRTMLYQDMEGDDDKFTAYPEEQKIVKDFGSDLQKSSPMDSSSKAGFVHNSESKLDNYPPHSDMNTKANSDAGKYVSSLPMEAEVNRGLRTLSEETEEVMNNDETEKENQDAVRETHVQECVVEGDPLCKSSYALLNLCKFPKVPTKTRSSLTSKGSKVGKIPHIEDSNTSNIGSLECSEVPVINDPNRSSLIDVPSSVTEDTKFLDHNDGEPSQSQFGLDAGKLDPDYDLEQAKCMRSQSFPDRMLVFDQGHRLSHERLRKSSSMVEERGEKRALSDLDIREGTKKPKEWHSGMVGKADASTPLSNLSKNVLNSQEEGGTVGEKVTIAVDQESLVNKSSFPKDVDEPSVEYSQEKQLFPNTFKICDLNLMESSDINENHNSDPVTFYPSISETKESMDIDLSISNISIPAESGRHASNSKDIEVIDLENDSDPERKDSDNSERKQEPIFVELDGFPNHAQDAGVIAEVQDYNDGLIISEFLNSFPNITPGPDVTNPLHNDMGMHNEEGTVGDDDSIYMSLGEIPLSFLQGWEQAPPQQYEKPF